MKYTIKSPEKDYSGVSAGVSFVNGKGETDNKQAALWLKEKGYDVYPNPNGKKEAPSKINKKETIILDEKNEEPLNNTEE